jgi:hypothetical protein
MEDAYTPDMAIIITARAAKEVILRERSARSVP